MVDHCNRLFHEREVAVLQVWSRTVPVSSEVTAFGPRKQKVVVLVYFVICDNVDKVRMREQLHLFEYASFLFNCLLKELIIPFEKGWYYQIDFIASEQKQDNNRK